MAPTNTSNPPGSSQSMRMNIHKTSANKPLLSTSKSNEDHTLGTGIRMDINSINTVRKILSTHGLILPTAGNMLQPIATALFEFSITANLGATHIDILQAMAFALMEIDHKIDVTNIVKKVQALMGGPVATLDEKVDELEKMIEKHRTTLEHTTSEISKHLNSTALKLSQITECITTSDHNNTTNEETTAHRNMRTYATVTKNGMQAPTAKIIACNEAQVHQILIER
jgi:hypothetical protein